MKLTQILATSLMAVFIPFAASAVTVDVVDTDYTDGVSSSVYGLSLGDEFSFQDNLDSSDSGGTIVLEFNNDLGHSVILSAFATANSPNADSDPDVEFNFDGGIVASILDNPGGLLNLSSPILAAGDNIRFFSRIGTITGGGTYDLDIKISATVVPIPAAGFLLIGALGGLVALRRRKA